MSKPKGAAVAKLTPRQRRFIDEYLLDLNGTRAAIRAGYSARTACEQSVCLLGKPAIAAAVAAAMAERSERTAIGADYVLRQAVKLHERCMQEIEPLVDRKGEHVKSGEGRPLYVFNATGAAKALEIVGKHVDVQAFRERVEMSGPGGGPIEVDHPNAEIAKALLHILYGVSDDASPRVIEASSQKRVAQIVGGGEVIEFGTKERA